MRFSSLPQEKVMDNKIDIKVTVKLLKENHSNDQNGCRCKS